MIVFHCDICGEKRQYMEKAYGGKGATFKLPPSWLSVKIGLACSQKCFQEARKKIKETSK